MKLPDRPLPSNVSAEKALLGAVMLENDLYAATTSLCADDFSLESHRVIYAHIKEMIEGSDTAVDLVTLTEDLRSSGELDSLCDTPVAYLSDLSSDTIRYKPAVKDWAKIIRAKSLQRQLIGACESSIKKCYEGIGGFDIIASLRENLDEIELAARQGVRTNP
jgi:replicative DNA helicase